MATTTASTISPLPLLAASTKTLAPVAPLSDASFIACSILKTAHVDRTNASKSQGYRKPPLVLLENLGTYKPASGEWRCFPRSFSFAQLVISLLSQARRAFLHRVRSTVSIACDIRGGEATKQHKRCGQQMEASSASVRIVG